MRHVGTVALLLVSFSAAAGAQQPSNPAVETARQLWRAATDYVLTAANDVPEDKYGYQPTPEVRTFRALFAHVAGAQLSICATALNETPRREDAIEESAKTKAEVIAALKETTAYCERAYRQSDADAQKRTTLFGADQSRLYALVLNATHNWEHYGNIVTYMRSNGMVPPSSRQP